jgi:hypothetical protein
MYFSPCVVMTSTQLEGGGGRCCSGAGWDTTDAGWDTTARAGTRLRGLGHDKQIRENFLGVLGT